MVRGIEMESLYGTIEGRGQKGSRTDESKRAQCLGGSCMVSSELFLKGQPSMLVFTPLVQRLDWRYGIHQLCYTISIGHGIYDPNTHDDLWTHSSLSTMRKPNPHLRHQHPSIKIFGQPKLLQEFPLWIAVCRGCAVALIGVVEYMWLR